MRLPRRFVESRRTGRRGTDRLDEHDLNVASVGDAGSEAIELAKGLLSDSQTRVVYQQASNELQGLRELLQLTEREVAAVSALSPGVALWKVGQRSFVVEHLVSRAERWIVDTEPRERITLGKLDASGSAA